MHWRDWCWSSNILTTWCNSWLIRKDSDAGKDWRQKRWKGMKEDEMVGSHHQFNGHEFEQTPGDGERQGSLSCCSAWGCKESDTTEQLNNNQYLYTFHSLNWSFHVFHFYYFVINVLSFWGVMKLLNFFGYYWLFPWISILHFIFEIYFTVVYCP